MEQDSNTSRLNSAKVRLEELVKVIQVLCAGKTYYEALGSMISAHVDALGIEIKWSDTPGTT